MPARPYPSGRQLRLLTPAATFDEAFPLGNGRLGAMVQGQLGEDHLTLNDDRLWAGLTLPGEDPFTCGHDEPVLPAGTLRLRWSASARSQEYERSLDLGTGVARFTALQNRIVRSAEHLVSVDEQVLAVRHTAEGGRLPRLRLTLDSPLRHHLDLVDGDLVLRGTVPTHVRDGRVDEVASTADALTYGDGARGYAIGVRITETDGTLSLDGHHIVVDDATSLTLLVAIASDHRGSDHVATVRADLDRGAADPFDVLRDRHSARHSELFDRVWVDLPTVHEIPEDTGDRLRAHHDGEFDPDLLALAYDFGRYLLISSSRPGSMPANRQGLWNDRVTPSAWCAGAPDVHTPLTYWPAAASGLGECLVPLLELTEALALQGRESARVEYGAGGWVAPAGRLPHGPAESGAPTSRWPVGGAWLCVDLLRAVDVSGNLDILVRSQRLALGAAEFLLDVVVDDLSEPSLLAQGTTLDVAVTRALFTGVLSAADTLAAARRDLDPGAGGLLDRIADALPLLPERRADRSTRVRPHPHVSDVFDLCPGTRVSLEETPELASGCVEALDALDALGDPDAGWSLAWAARARARLGQSEHALSLLGALLAPIGSPDGSDDDELGPDGGGARPNLMMARPSFLMAANLGFVSALQELFVQDHTGIIDLLPACPPELATGRLAGVELHGGVRLDFAWSGGRIIAACMRSEVARRVRLRYEGRVLEVDLEPGRNDLFAALLRL